MSTILTTGKGWGLINRGRLVVGNRARVEKELEDVWEFDPSTRPDKKHRDSLRASAEGV